MALIKLTAIVDNISGKLNGTVFSKNKGGHYMRSKSMPSNPKTSFQTAVRARFGAIAQLWGALTEAQRDAWRAMASEFPYTNRLGDTKILSGFALHQKLNTNLTIVGQPAISNPPEPVSPPSLIRMSLDASRSAEELNIQGELAMSVSSVPYKAVIMATPPLRDGVANFTNQLREIATTEDITRVDIWDDYSSRYGAPVPRQKIGIAVHTIALDSGVASVQLTDIVVIGE